MSFASASGSISFAGAESGGASTDFDAISGGDGSTAGATLADPCAVDETVAGPGSAAGALAAGFSAAAAGMVATADTVGEGGFCGADGGSAVAVAVAADAA